MYCQENLHFKKDQENDPMFTHTIAWASLNLFRTISKS